jgi:hypothetical protein
VDRDVQDGTNRLCIPEEEGEEEERRKERKKKRKKERKKHVLGRISNP